MSLTWFFGASSDWSQKFISNLRGEVIQFGRIANPSLNIKEVKYNPSEFINWLNTVSSLPIPDRIVFNINTGNPRELVPYKENLIKENFNIFNEWWDDCKHVQFFKYTLLDYLITVQKFNGEVCMITSQISVDHDPRYSHLFTYKSIRAIDYELIWNFRNRGINAYGVCPATNARPLEWADYISKFIQTDTIGRNEWLYGVAEDFNNGQLNMVTHKI